MIRPIEWKDDKVIMIDQRRLPWEEKWYNCRNYKDVAKCIRVMVIRGAPAIGVAAAMGLALGARAIKTKEQKPFFKELKKISAFLASQRPTAANLVWALNRMENLAASLSDLPVDEIKERLIQEAKDIHEEDIEINRRIGANGANLVPDGAVVLTHCNAGALATGGYGTALGVVRAAVEQGKEVQVIADETRPFLQGARLTAWELQQDNIPVKVITDGMAGHLMKTGLIDLAVVGADRIAANGDAANKIGTYQAAVLARRHKIPFYVAAPLSTIDMNTKTGQDIPIEERPAEEITHIRGKQITPDGVEVIHPAFDVTPAELITAIITEKAVVRKYYRPNIKKLFEE